MVSGKKFLKYAREAIAEYPEIFWALEEYDKTGKLPQIDKYVKKVK